MSVKYVFALPFATLSVLSLTGNATSSNCGRNTLPSSVTAWTVPPGSPNPGESSTKVSPLGDRNSAGAIGVCAIRSARDLSASSMGPRSSERTMKKRIVDATTTVSATAAAAATAIRARKLIAGSCRLAEGVAHAANRVDQARLPARLGLTAEVPDVDVERVRGRAEVVAPDALE